MTQLYHGEAGVSSVKPKLFRFTNLTTASENGQKKLYQKHWGFDYFCKIDPIWNFV